MSILDRYIIVRFSINFLILFALLFFFAVAVELVVNLDEFVDGARNLAGPDANAMQVTAKLIVLAADFQGPRLFQFYAYLHGLTAIGAMGFTLAQMHRHRELVAVMASGVSLYRVAAPFFAVVFGLAVVQVLNQELVLPRVAPLLIRGYDNMGQKGADVFAIKFTPDGNGHLFQAPRFDPQTATLTSPTILERDSDGRTLRRITASQAVWSDQQQRWLLTDGQAIQPRPTNDASDQLSAAQPIDSYATDLNPQALLVRRYNEFAAMLSLGQISQMLQADQIAHHDEPRRNALLRYRYSRLSSVLATLLVLGLSLPCFLLREPANLLRQSVLCASLAIPATIGAALGMMLEMPGIPPAVGVFLPVIILMFTAIFPWTFFKT